MREYTWWRSVMDFDADAAWSRVSVPVLLAASLIPSTLAKHPFWTRTDPEEKALDKDAEAELAEALDGFGDSAFRRRLVADVALDHQHAAPASRRFDELFEGPPRKAESPVTAREMDIAASVQNSFACAACIE